MHLLKSITSNKCNDHDFGISRDDNNIIMCIISHLSLHFKSIKKLWRKAHKV